MVDSQYVSITPTVPGFAKDAQFLESSQQWREGKWVRFYNGRLRTMDGIQEISEATQISSPIRNIFVENNLKTGNPKPTIFMLGGTTAFVGSLQKPTLDVRTTIGLATAIDVTPTAVDGGLGPNGYWVSDLFFDEVTASSSSLLAFYVDSSDQYRIRDTDGEVYYHVSSPTDTSTFATIGKQTAGGLMVLQPYVVTFDRDGTVSWSDQNNFFATASGWTAGDAGSDRVTNETIVRGIPYKGTSGNPRALLWSPSKLILMTYVGGSAIFGFNELGNISLIANNVVAELDQIFYWIGHGKAYAFDGTIRELPNTQVLQDFFENRQEAYTYKMFVLPMHQWGEIWWFYPRGNQLQTECNYALIYNVRERVWYDTEIPSYEVCAAWAGGSYRFPIVAELTTFSTSAKLLHYAVDSPDYLNISGTPTQSIDKSAKTGPIFAGDSDRNLFFDEYEPDSGFTGSWEWRVSRREYPNDSDTTTTHAFTGTDVRVQSRHRGRYFSFEWAATSTGAECVMGNERVHLKPGEGRP